MAHDTRASRKAKDARDSPPKEKDVASKSPTNSGVATPDASGLRRSSRDTSVKKSMSPSPSSTRKSERLEKQAPKSVPFKRKFDEVEKRSEPISLRRSKRGKKQSPSSSSGSKKSDGSLDSSVLKKKHKKERSVSQLTLETRPVKTVERSVTASIQKGKKRLNARAYRALFEQATKANVAGNDVIGERAELSKECRTNKGGGSSKNFDVDDELSQINVEEVREKEHNSGSDSERTSKEPIEEAQENTIPEVVEATVNKGTSDPAIRLVPETSCNFKPSEPQRSLGDTGSDATALVSSNDAGSSANDVIECSPHRCNNDNSEETSGTCFVMPRINDSKQQGLCSGNNILNQDLCGTSLLKDRAETEGGISKELAEQCISILDGKESTIHLQQEGNENTCFICKLGEKLMCCDGKGCQRRYHLSCLDPSLKDFTFGVCHCYSCVRKKILVGVHEVSDGIESIWDSKEVEVFDGNALQSKKQFFVKYKGLAHVHNRWLPEGEVLCEAPSLVGKFNDTNQVTRWKSEWMVPRRLLQKRSLVSYKQQDEHCRIDCHHEWLVKWLGLGYEHATWELENASFMNSPEAKSLMTEYENRCERVKKALCSDRIEKKLGMEIGPLVKLSPGFDDNHLDFVNNLRERWHKGWSSIVIDDQERMMKVVSFILSLLSHVSWPFLIISTSAALHSWDEEFFCLAPLLDVVVYHGDKEVRKHARMVEFCKEGNFMMSQVLITSAEVISEDLDVFASTKWAAIFVDQCQFSDVYAHLEQIKLLSGHMMLFLVNGQLKDEIAGHLLSLLEYQSDMNLFEGLVANSSPRAGSLKERLSKYVVNGCKLDSRFLEYWVPVGISNIQLEQYCAILLSNSLLLCSSLKTDNVGSIQDILRDARKCCDHPYLVDTSLQESLTKGVREAEILEIGIKASGKLQLLDMMLSEIRRRDLRVLVLFQSSVGSGKTNIGDILDDFVRQRFGKDSYERFDGLVIPSKRQAALHSFNNQEGRFVFLMETRACTYRVKLSSVDFVIIYGSDWSPMNDTRNLQRITLDSKLERIKVFRLYSSFTVEEKALILARQDNAIESKIQNSNRITCHMLLMWGASYLFGKLVEFHSCSQAFSGSSMFKQLLLKDVIQEFFVILGQSGKEDNPRNCSLIAEVQTRGLYNTDFPLPGEQKIRVTEEELPHLFWKKLLDGKQPQWRYPSSSFQTQRKRKKVQYFNDLHEGPLANGDGVSKKRKKVPTSNSYTPFSKPPPIKAGGDKLGTSGSLAFNVSASLPRSTDPQVADDLSEAPEQNIDRLTEQVNLRDSQKSLHCLLKPEIAKLCEVLRLPGNVKAMVKGFLDYVMSFHHVSREPATILQAFQISVCWTASSILKYKLDHKESLSIAKQHLNFDCKKEEADYVYSMLRCLKDVFLYRTGNSEVSLSPIAPHTSPEELHKDHVDARSSRSTLSNIIQEQVVAEQLRCGKEFSDDRVSHLELARKDFSRSIKDIEKKYRKQMSKLLEKQQKEKEEIQSSYDDEKAQLEKRKRTEAAVIRLHIKGSMKTNQLKLLETKYTEKFDKLKFQMEKRLKHLEEMHLFERERKAQWVEEVKSRALVELINKEMEDNQESIISQDSCLKEQISGGGPSTQDGQNPPEVLENISLNNNEGTLPVMPSIADQIADQTSSRVLDAEVLPEVLETASVDNGTMNIVSGNLPSSDIQIFQTTPEIHDKEVPPRVPETVSVNDSPVNIISTNSPSSDEQIPCVDVTLTFPEIVSSGDVVENNISKPSSEERNFVAPLIGDPNKELPAEVADVCSNAGIENIGFLNHPSGKHTSYHEVSHGGEALMTASETAASEQMQDVITSTEQNRLSALPSGNSAEVDQQDPTICMANQDPHSSVTYARIELQNDENLSGEPEASQHEQQDDTTHGDDLDGNYNAQPMAGTAAVNQQVGEDSSEVPETAVAVVAGDDFTDRENNGVDVVPSHCSSRLDKQAEVILPSMSETPCELVEGEIIVRGFDGVRAVSTVGSTGAHQTNEVLSSSHQSREFSHINSSSIEPAVALAEEHSIPLDQVTHGEYCQPLQEGRHLDTVFDLPVEVVETPMEPSNQAASLPPVTSFLQHLPSENAVGGLDMHFSDTRSTEISNSSIPSAPAARTLATPSPDPLQNELEILMKETEKTIKAHEDTKLQLKSDCEREIEKEVAKIRRKYEIKFKEIELAFNLKKKELDANHKKVLMNKILAEAFRSKCMDIRGSIPSGMQQEIASSFMHQLQQPSPPPSTLRPPVSLSLAGSSGSLHNSSLPAHPASTLQSTITPLQSVNHSLAPSSGTRGALPLVSSFSPTTGIFQAGGQMRTPPHLQHARPSAFTSAASLSSISHGMSSNSSTTHMTSQPSPGLPPSYQSGPNMIHRLPGSSAGFPSLSSSSAMGLPRDSENQTNRSRIPPLNSSPLTHLASNSPLLQANHPDTMLVSPASSQDVVCLSDDD